MNLVYLSEVGIQFPFIPFIFFGYSTLSFVYCKNKHVVRNSLRDEISESCSWHLKVDLTFFI